MGLLIPFVATDPGLFTVFNTKVVEPTNEHIQDETIHFTATEKADNIRKDLNFKRKLRLGGMI